MLHRTPEASPTRAACAFRQKPATACRSFCKPLPRRCLPYTEGALLHRLEQQGQIFRREYTAEGTLLDAEVEQRDWRLYEPYLKMED